MLRQAREKLKEPVSEHFYRNTCVFIWIWSNIWFRDPVVNFGFAVQTGIWWCLVNICLGLYKSKPKSIWCLGFFCLGLGGSFGCVFWGGSCVGFFCGFRGVFSFFLERDCLKLGS